MILNIKVSPSLLSCDFLHLGEEIKRAEASGGDMLHFDVMDGMFVNNISFGVPLLKAVKKISSVPLDVHLMISEPIRYIKSFADAGADIITFHIEACSDVVSTIDEVKKCGKKVGISVKPSTPINEVFKYIELVDMVLIMTVEPGFGGQSFIDDTVDKIKFLKKYCMELNQVVDIQVDGGINDNTLSTVIEAGANVIVSGSYLFGAKDMSKEIAKIKSF